jgi:hypothetical protein
MSNGPTSHAAEYKSEWCDMCDDHPDDPGGSLHLCQQCTAIETACGGDIAAVGHVLAYVRLLNAECELSNARAAWDKVKP